MMTPVKGLILFLMIYFLPASFEDKHSLLYLYTMQSKNSDYHLYDCTAETLLNDRQIDFYNSSSDKPRTAKQNWLKNIPESDWETSTEKLQYDTQLLNKLLDIQMSESGHSHSDGHVLQWRHGCEGEQSSDGSLTVLNSINEFGYDGEDLIQFNCISKTWITPEEKKNREREEKWSRIFNAVRKCDQCEEILKMYLHYRTTDITQSNTPPDVHIFAKKSVRDSRKLTLTCLITGFYPKHVKMSLRKFTTEIPDHLITSSGVRPNDDGTYQLRKSVEISGDDSADYYCYVSHSSFTEPVIKQWDDFPNKGSLGLFIEVAVSVNVYLLSLWSVMLYVLIRRRVKYVRSWVLIVGGAVSGVVVLLCFVILCILMMIKNGRSPYIMIGVLVLGGLLSLCSVILCTLMMMIKCARRRRRQAELRKVFALIPLSDVRSWVLIVGGAVLGVVALLCFVILCILMMIKNGRSPDIRIGVLVLGGLLSLCSVILCILIMIKCAREEDLRKRHEQSSLSSARRRREAELRKKHELIFLSGKNSSEETAHVEEMDKETYAG